MTLIWFDSYEVGLHWSLLSMCKPRIRTRLLPHTLALAGDGGLQESSSRSILTLTVKDGEGVMPESVVVGITQGE